MDTTMTRVDIRPFTGNDYAAITRLHNLNYPDFLKEPHEFRFRDEHFPEHCQWARWVATAQGQIVGFGGYHQTQWAYHPRKFSLWFAVDPEWYGRGIGSRLYDLVLDALEPLQPLAIDGWSREDVPALIGFLERRGFAPNMRLWTSALDLTTFEPSMRPNRRSTVIERLTLGPAVRRAAALLAISQATADALAEHFPAARERTTVALLGPAPRSEAYVGLSQLWYSPEPDMLRTGLTGVRRAYRRRGLALALKVRSLAFAKQQGYRRVITDNESNNRGMLHINEQLGFVKNPAWLHYVKTFEE